MISQLKESLKRYESIVDAFKRQVESINTDKLAKLPPASPKKLPEPMEKTKRQKNNSEMRKKAIDMMLHLMYMDKLSKHRASKVVAREMGLRSRTVYSWLNDKKQLN